MNKPHKYADVIKAWADGALIECRWADQGEWALCSPSWHTGYAYRIKPKPLVKKYQFAYGNTYAYVSSHYYTDEADFRQRTRNGGQACKWVVRLDPTMIEVEA